MGRISKIENKDFARAVAEAYIDGASRDEMADMFGVHKDTITDWCRDDKVQVHAAAFARERALQIKRITDKEIRDRLQHADDEERMPTELLLKIRKEFVGRYDEVEGGSKNSADQPETINEALANLEDDPELARKLQEWAKGEARATTG